MNHSYSMPPQAVAGQSKAQQWVGFSITPGICMLAYERESLLLQSLGLDFFLVAL